MNRKGLTAQSYLIGSILFSIIIALLYISAGSLSTDYGATGVVDPSFSQHYDTLSNNTAKVGSMFNAVSSKEGLNVLGTFNILISSIWSVISLIFESFSTTTSSIGHIGTDFGIPSQITGVVVYGFLAILTVLIIFLIINGVNKTRSL